MQDIPHTQYGYREKADHLAAVFSNLIVLWIINNVQGWNLSFVTDAYPAVLWVLNVAVVAQILGNGALVIYGSRWLHHLVNLVLHVLGVLSLIVLYVIYPFDFGAYNGVIEWLARIGLIVGILASLFSTMYYLLKVLSDLSNSGRNKGE